MEQPEAAPQFSLPFLQLTQMLIALGGAGAGVVLALPRVLPVFLTNLYLNGFILLVFVFGVAATFWQVWMMFKSVNWIVDFAAEED
ncbi:MAG: biopolymer transporter ExbB, partial [Rhodobacterales bacterium]|nr:biopolymer transporter ExbB [Rhodobacterales bacterium]